MLKLIAFTLFCLGLSGQEGSPMVVGDASSSGCITIGGTHGMNLCAKDAVYSGQTPALRIGNSFEEFQIGTTSTAWTDKLINAQGFSGIYHENFTYRNGAIVIKKPMRVEYEQSGLSAAPPPTICGRTIETERFTIVVACVPWDALRKFLPVPEGKHDETQVFIQRKDRTEFADVFASIAGSGWVQKGLAAFVDGQAFVSFPGINYTKIEVQ